MIPRKTDIADRVVDIVDHQIQVKARQDPNIDWIASWLHAYAEVVQEFQPLVPS